MIEAQVTEAAANRSRRNRGHARPRPVGYLAERSAAEAALRAAGTLRAGIPAVMVHGEAVARRKDACCGTASGMLLNSGEVVFIGQRSVFPAFLSVWGCFGSSGRCNTR